MALSALGRKHLLEHGRQRRVARRERVSDGYVSAVNAGELRPKTKKGWIKYRRVQRAIATELDMTVEEAFSAYERGEENLEGARQVLVA